MKEEEIEQIVRRELADALQVEEALVTRSSFLVEDLGAESIDFIDMTFRLEKAFALTVPEKELFDDPALPPGSITVGHVVDYIRRRLS